MSLFGGDVVLCCGGAGLFCGNVARASAEARRTSERIRWKFSNVSLLQKLLCIALNFENFVTGPARRRYRRERRRRRRRARRRRRRREWSRRGRRQRGR